jgi:mannose-6-phosphate isomerase-like protein (cupin superfamily)
LNSKSKIVKKGWGLEIHFVNHNQYCLKYLIFFKGKKFSLHKHSIKKELWYCSWGKFECYIKNQEFEDYFIFKQGDKIEILPGIEHQLQALTNCIITEVSTTDYPEDSIRIEKGD